MEGADHDTHLCLVCNNKIVGLMNYVTHKQKICIPDKVNVTDTQQISPVLSISVVDQPKTIPDYLKKDNLNFEPDITIDILPLTESESESIIPRALSQNEPITDIVLQTLPVTSSESISYNILPNLQGFTNDISSSNAQSVPETQSPSQHEHNIPDGLSLVINQLNSFMNEDFPTTSQPLGSNSVSSPSTDSFFQSLELQSRKSPNKTKSSINHETRNIYSTLENLSITNFLNNLDFSSDDDLTNFPSGDEYENSDDDSYTNLKPPRLHTGGKWKPGEYTGYKHRRSGGKKMPGGKWKPGMLNNTSKESKKKPKVINKIYECKACDLTFSSPYVYSSHCRQKSHKTNTANMKSKNKINKNSDNCEEQNNLTQRTKKDEESECEANPLIISLPDIASSAASTIPKTTLVITEEIPTTEVVTNDEAPQTHLVTNEECPKAVKVMQSIPKLSYKLQESTTGDVKEKKLFRRHICTICDKKFTRKYDIVSHLMTRFHKSRAVDKHIEELQLLLKYERYLVKLCAYQCAICQFYFHRHTDLVHHTRTPAHIKKCEERIGDMTCLLCGTSFENVDQLTYHLADRVHLDAVHSAKNSRICVIKDVVNLTCKYCGLKQGSFNRLKLHYEARHKDKKITSPVQRSKTSIRPSCPYCSHTFAYPSAVTLHINRIHRSDRAFTCVPCKKSYVDKYAYDKHLQTRLHNRKTVLIASNKKVFVSFNDSKEIDNICITKSEPKAKRNFKCEMCEFHSPNYEDLRKHYMDKHKEEVTLCKICQAIFLSVKAYRVHCSGRTHQANLSTCEEMDINIEGEATKIVECPKCPKKFSDEKWMNLHIEFIHNHTSSEEALLQIPGFKSKVTELYGDHLKQIENMPADASVSCPECGKFVNHERIVEHLRTHTDERPFLCILCNRGFIGRLSLRRHLMVHVGLTENTCKICNREFKRHNSYKTHMESHKSTENHVCSECGQTFPLLKQLNYHMKRHGARPYQCEYKGCTWSFVLRNELKMHYLSHTGEKKFLCDQCGFGSTTKSRLERHKNIHSGERNYSCEYCTYKAGNPTHLRRHMRIHIGAKPFQCPYCSYACNTHENIRKHILKTKKHEGMPVYPCKFCKFGSSSSQEFRSHLIKYHSSVVKLDSLDKLAEYSGLYNRSNDPRQPVEGTQIFPSKERKVNPKSSKKLRIEEATSLFSKSPKIEPESSPEKKPQISKLDNYTTQTTSHIPQTEETDQWQEVITPNEDMRIEWDPSCVPNVAYQTEVEDGKVNADFNVLQHNSNVPVPYSHTVPTSNLHNMNNYYYQIL